MSLKVAMQPPNNDDYRSFVREWMEKMHLATWVLKIKGSTRVKNPETGSNSRKTLEHLFGGVCVRSDGIIVTSSDAMESGLENKELGGVNLAKTVVYGRVKGSEFQRLTFVWADTESDLMYYRAGEEMGTYIYADVCNGVVPIGSELLGVGINGDQPYSCFECYSAGPNVEHSCDKLMYMQVHGKHLVVTWELYDKCVQNTTMAGSPIFNKDGQVVSIASLMGDRNYIFAIPLDEAAMTRFRVRGGSSSRG